MVWSFCRPKYEMTPALHKYLCCVCDITRNCVIMKAYRRVVPAVVGGTLSRYDMTLTLGWPVATRGSLWLVGCGHMGTSEREATGNDDGSQPASQQQRPIRYDKSHGDGSWFNN